MTDRRVATPSLQACPNQNEVSVRHHGRNPAGHRHACTKQLTDWVSEASSLEVIPNDIDEETGAVGGR